MDAPNTYLFTAYYDDGEIYEQGELDRSLQDGERNAFYDIFYKPIKPLVEMHTFCSRVIDPAAHAPSRPKAVAVDLRTGQFGIDGLSFFQHNNFSDPYLDFRLIYFRAVKQHQTITVGTLDGAAAKGSVAVAVKGMTGVSEFKAGDSVLSIGRDTYQLRHDVKLLNGRASIRISPALVDEQEGDTPVMITRVWHEIEYVIGWQTKDAKGGNVSRFVKI